jgi:hypothetical protein
MRCHDAIRSLSTTGKNWGYPESVETVLLGFGNVMIRYKFEPFIQLIEMNEGDWWIRESNNREQSAAIIIDNMVEFINRKK